MNTFIILLIVSVVILLLWLVFKIRRIPKFGNMLLVTGGIKSGKSTLTVYLAIRKYKWQHFIWRIKSLFKKGLEEPLLYSNVPLYDVEYVPLPTDLLVRKMRFNYGSVCLLQESSLIANSQCFKNQTINEQLLLFNKLYGHETKGGYVIYDTQSINDNHYAVKRCLNSYLHIYRTIKIPLLPWLIMQYRVQEYSEDKGIINTKEMGDGATDFYDFCLVPKSVWKKFDCYCYSVFTDELPPLVNLTYNGKKKFSDVKVTEIPSFVKYKHLKAVKETKENEKNK